MNTDWVAIPGGVTAPKGFQATAVKAGLKPSGSLDLTLITSVVPAVVGGVFTTNIAKAACVTYNQRLVASGDPVRAIICNAGQANACTGAEGEADNLKLAEMVGAALGIPGSQVLVASTGVIGKRLELEKVERALPALVESLSVEGGDLAAQGILTTDLVPKTVALETQIEGKPVRIGGIAKGSGMIHPNMATMLAFITCDAAVDPKLWRSMTRSAAEISFNQITVDGDTSTNDMLLTLANGQSGVSVIQEDTPAALVLQEMLHAACGKLAMAIARDGEGATKLIEVRVEGGETAQHARQIARTIAGSALVKAAAYGNDPNWGRIVAAAGRAGVDFDLQRLDVYLGSFQLMQGGKPLSFDRAAASTYLKTHDPVQIRLDLHQGFAVGVAWGCDLSYDYVRINAEYTT
ncbi:MAG: bifunctional glutamate N-acetyltransferase/amino-acid acetyltransferase ArgJ [Thermostichales cyanobacterium DRC_bins_46]